MEHFAEKYKQLIYVLIFTAGFIILGIITGLIFIKPVFTSTASYLVTDTSGLHNEIVHPDEIKSFFRKDYFTDHLSEHIANKFSGAELRKMVKVKTSTHSPTFKVKVTCSAAADVFFIQKTIETAPKPLTHEMSDEYFLVIQTDEAKFPEKTSRPGFSLLVIISALAGAAVSVLFVLKQDISFNQKTTESLDRYKFPVVARIPRHHSSSGSADSPETAFTSAFLKNSGIALEKKKNTGIASYNPDKNTIMIGPDTNIEFFDAFRLFYSTVTKMSETENKIILFTSPVNGDGKTTAALNLGITAAAEGRKVLLIDCNLRNRRISRAFNIDPSIPGLYDMAFRAMPAKDAILFTEYHSLFVLPPGECGNNPLSLLTRTETLSVIFSLKDMFDYIIIDTPPVNHYADAIALSPIADLILVTIRNRFTPDEEIEKALKSLELSELTVSGFVMNDVSLTADSSGITVPKNNGKNRFISGFGI